MRSWWQEIEALGPIVSFLSQEREREMNTGSLLRDPPSQ